jgi:hypothetical protein
MKMLIVLFLSVFAFGVPEVHAGGLTSDDSHELVVSAASSTSVKKMRTPAIPFRLHILACSFCTVQYLFSPNSGLLPRETLFLRLRVLRL